MKEHISVTVSLAAHLTSRLPKHTLSLSHSLGLALWLVAYAQRLMSVDGGAWLMRLTRLGFVPEELLTPIMHL